MFFDRDPDPLWKVIADKGMLNLKVPSIKTVKVPDPNNRDLLTTLTDDEYFEFAKARGQYIKSELSKVVDGKRKIRVDRKLQRKLQAEGKTIKVDRRISEYDILDADWMTEVQKEATEIAKLKVVEMREKSIK
jgi:transposase